MVSYQSPLLSLFPLVCWCLDSDVSNPCWRKQEVSVTSVLDEIGAGDTPIIRVFNKIDLLDAEDAEILKYEAATCPDGEFSVGIQFTKSPARIFIDLSLT